jgi:hypothetical protein
MATIERRTGKDNHLIYRAKVRRKGHPPQTATFTRRSDALKWIQITEAAILEGRHFKTAVAKRHTLTDLIERYTRDVLPHKGTRLRLTEHSNCAGGKRTWAIVASLT